MAKIIWISGRQWNGKYAFSAPTGGCDPEAGARFPAERASAPAAWTRPQLRELWSDNPTFRIRSFSLSGDLRNTTTNGGYWIRTSHSADRMTRIVWMRVVITQLPNSRQRPRAATMSDLNGAATPSASVYAIVAGPSLTIEPSARNTVVPSPRT